MSSGYPALSFTLLLYRAARCSSREVGDPLQISWHAYFICGFQEHEAAGLETGGMAPGWMVFSLASQLVKLIWQGRQVRGLSGVLPHASTVSNDMTGVDDLFALHNCLFPTAGKLVLYILSIQDLTGWIHSSWRWLTMHSLLLAVWSQYTCRCLGSPVFTGVYTPVVLVNAATGEMHCSHAL